MEWRDEGLIIGLRRHGETSVIVELMTREHGRHLGIVKGGRSRRVQPMLQQGNSVSVVWRARLEEHLGLYQLDLMRSRAADIMDSGLALAGTGLLGDHLRLLPERDPHAGLFDMACVIADHFHQPAIAGALMVRFELAMLSELGFRLDLSECAATGQREELIYVSPKSGKAVCAQAGEPYKDRLLPLPAFLGEGAALDGVADGAALEGGFRLAGYFLERDIFRPRGLGMPGLRQKFIEAVCAHCDAPATLSTGR